MKQEKIDRIKTYIFELFGTLFYSSIIIFVGSTIGVLLNNTEPYFLILKFDVVLMIISGIIWKIITRNKSWWDSWKRVKGEV